ncbi:GAF domain-containing protein [Mucilaginibacter ginkgonis]|uniref:GAF domain-containing protein n=1 Tax=Mucilaginibacter ginkgonis TaxID=2682091 RepID=A0A6I4IMQ7_9SPHI|nr:GAF domain-containing protein [Mucilaginibacter ginkgonis]QQL50240.1 GAF domain-containing protein [Mucilaginibacter ginkgonis]
MPKRELERLQAVNRFLKLKISKEEELQEIVSLAADICGTPTALITLIDSDTQYIPFKQAFNFETTPRSHAFCTHVIEQADFLMVEDTEQDLRFLANPLVTEDPHIRFYAGTPLTTQDGLHLGSLCVINQTPGTLSKEQQQMLQILAEQVIQLLEFDASLEMLKDQFLSAKKEELTMHSFFDSCACAHLLLDLDFKVTAYSKAMSDFIYEHHGIKINSGYSIMELIDPIDRERVTSACNNALQGISTKMERHIEFKNKSYWWDVAIDPARNPDGEIIGVSYNGSDISERIRQKASAEAQRLKLDEIAFNQSHQLRRPVATLKGLLTLIDIEGELQNCGPLKEMQHYVEQLDNKIHLIVDYTNH